MTLTTPLGARSLRPGALLGSEVIPGPTYRLGSPKVAIPGTIALARKKSRRVSVLCSTESCLGFYHKRVCFFVVSCVIVPPMRPFQLPTPGTIRRGLNVDAFNKSHIPAVGRTLAVLELLAHSRRPLNISEVSRALNLPKSSTSRMLTALESERCVQRDTRSGRYRFGFRLVGLSRAAVENLQIREVAKPYLISLMLSTGLAIHLTVLEYGQAIIIEKIDAPGLGGVGTWPGRAMDINSTAAGKALVAFLSNEDFDRQVKSRAFVKHNQRTISSLAKLKEHLVRVRELGYSVDDEEDQFGSRCIGAPVFDGTGKTVAAISVVGTADQIPREQIRHLGATVKRCAASISSCLGAV